MAKVNNKRRQPWHFENAGLLTRVKELLSERFPTLRLGIESDVVFIRGSFVVIADDGSEIDRYLVEIELPSDFPHSVPVVREIGNRIPRIDDRHINDKDGTCCLFLDDESWRFFPQGTTIVEFLEGPVFQFFLAQTYFELTGKWIFGQRAHRGAGVLEYYKEILNTDSRDVVLRFLRFLSSGTVKVNERCYCGNSKTLRRCHIANVLEMRGKVARKIARNSLTYVLLCDDRGSAKLVH